VTKCVLNEDDQARSACTRRGKLLVKIESGSAVWVNLWKQKEFWRAFLQSVCWSNGIMCLWYKKSSGKDGKILDLGKNGLYWAIEPYLETGVSRDSIDLLTRHNEAMVHIYLMNFHQDRFPTIQEFRDQYLAMKTLCYKLKLGLGICARDDCVKRYWV